MIKSSWQICRSLLLLTALLFLSQATAKEGVDKAIQTLQNEVSKLSSKPVSFTLNKRGAVDIVHGILSPALSAKKADAAALDFLKTHKALFKVADTQAELALKDSKRDNFGLQHVTFTQQYQGIPVAYRQMTVHFNQREQIHAVTGNFVPEIQLATTTPAIDGQTAIERIKTANNLHGNTLLEEARLIVFHNEWENSDHLAYLVKITAGPEFSRRIIVDAISGEVITWYTAVHEAGPTTGSGTDAFDNPVSNLHMYDGTGWATGGSTVLSQARGNTGAFNLVDESHPGLGTIYGMNGNHDDLQRGPFYDFSKVDYLSSSSSTFGTSEVDKAGVSGALGFEATLEYFFAEHGRSGIDDAGMPVIHIQDWYLSSNPYNAFWDGNLGFMAFSLGGTFGSTVYRPISAAMDVVGHELAHGVTDRSSNLLYQNHSGALNESWSDVFGYLVEAWSSGDYTDWLMAEDAYVNISSAFRSLQDPPAFGDPDNVTHPNYIAPVASPSSSNDYGGVHTNSGIPNKVFYLLSAGDTHYGITVSAFDANLATSAELVADLHYLVNTGGYYTSTTDFDQARAAMEAAVAALFPGDNVKAQAVSDAWSSVGVGVTGNQSPTADANGPYNGDINVAVNFSSAGSSDPDGSIVSYSWDFGDGNSSTAANPSHTYTSSGTFNVSLTVTDDQGATGTDNTTATISGPSQTMSTSISMSTTTQGPWLRALATVTVTSNGTPLSGAVVNIDWTGTETSSASGTTDGNGVVAIQSDRTKASSWNFTATITSVTLSGYNWDGANNTGSISSGGNANGILEIAPAEFALDQNFPNPFNPTTTIAYRLAEESSVSLKIFTVSGQLVRTLVNAHQAASSYNVTWDGTNDAGRKVVSGVYIYRLEAGEFVANRRLIMLK